jgi:hypothetical protein
MNHMRRGAGSRTSITSVLCAALTALTGKNFGITSATAAALSRLVVQVRADGDDD